MTYICHSEEKSGQLKCSLYFSFFHAKSFVRPSVWGQLENQMSKDEPFSRLSKAYVREDIVPGDLERESRAPLG